MIEQPCNGKASSMVQPASNQFLTVLNNMQTKIAVADISFSLQQTLLALWRFTYEGRKQPQHNLAVIICSRADTMMLLCLYEIVIDSWVGPYFAALTLLHFRKVLSVIVAWLNDDIFIYTVICIVFHGVFHLCCTLTLSILYSMINILNCRKWGPAIQPQHVICLTKACSKKWTCSVTKRTWSILLHWDCSSSA